MKAQEENSYKEAELLAAKRESAIEPKGEKTTPRKTKGSPSKREVGTLRKCVIRSTWCF